MKRPAASAGLPGRRQPSAASGARKVALALRLNGGLVTNKELTKITRFETSAKSFEHRTSEHASAILGLIVVIISRPLTARSQTSDDPASV